MTRIKAKLLCLACLAIVWIGAAPAGAEDGGKMVVRLVDESAFYIEDVGNGKPEARIVGQIEKVEDGARQTARLNELGLVLEVGYAFKPGRVEVNGLVRDTTGQDRALVVKFRLPLDARGWTWWDDIRTSRPIRGEGLYQNCAGHGEGGGQHSIYPFACVSKDVALCIGIPLDIPVVHRLSYDADRRCFGAAFDLGLSQATTKFPSSAKFSIVVFDAPAEWGFRGAADRYYRIYPDSFSCRAKRQGIWMPFTKISQIERAEDFGFGFDEGVGDVVYDNAHGILSFVYVEPWSLRFYLPPDTKKMPSPEEALADPTVKEKQANLIGIAKSCGIHMKDGKYSTQMYTADWARGKTVYDFLVSADPDLPGEVTKAKVMDEAILGRMDKEKEQGNTVDGVYFDGFGEWRRPSENYRKDLWAYADYPLTISWETKKPVQLTCFSVYEYVAHMARKLKPKGKFLMANGFVCGFPFMAHYLDVGGNEIHWMRQTGADDAYLDLRRTMACQKPVLPLNNEDFTVFADREVEKYFTKCLYYGFLPSMFSPGASAYGNYWNTPEFHDRDRHLFKKYIPIMIQVAEAGWEPLTYAWPSDPLARVERFGRGLEGNVHLTVYNDSDVEREFDVKVDRERLGIPSQDQIAYDLVSGKELEAKMDWGKWRVRGRLAPRGVAAIWPTSRARAAGHYVALGLAKIDTASDRVEAGKLADAEKKEVCKKLSEIARYLRMSPFDTVALAAEMAEARRLGLDKTALAAGLGTDLDDLSETLSQAQMLLSGVRMEIAGDAIAPAGRAARVVLQVANKGELPLDDVKLTLLSVENGELRTVGSAAMTGIEAGSAREVEVSVAVPKTARVGSYMPLISLLTADRNAKLFALRVRSSLVVSPLCDIRVVRCADEPKFQVTVQNHARNRIEGTICPTPPTGWSADPAEAAVTVDGQGTAGYAFTLAPPKDAPAEMCRSLWTARIEGMDKPFQQELLFGYAPSEKSIAANGGFEEDKTGWTAYEKGFAVVGGGRNGGHCLQCENTYVVDASGAVQTIALNQKTPQPLLLRAWSKAESVSGGKNKDYSVYVDIKYTDGTSLYGQTVDFAPGTHDWECAECLIQPEKPIASLMVYALFRKHSGKVWFDDVRLCPVGK